MAAKKVNFGPLQHLIGTWSGDKGMDIAPEKPSSKTASKKTLPEEENPYFETITIEPVGDVTNAKEQTLVVLRYHQSVFRKSDKEQFHDEIGYWMWNAANDKIMQSLMIPRGVGLLAGGKATESKGSITYEVKAASDSAAFGIVQSPFMQKKAKTEKFSHTVTITGKTMVYSETTTLNIYGKRFQHTDSNTLTKS